MSYLNNATVEFAKRIKALGFRVYVAKDGTGHYGFVSDDAGARVLSFSFADGASLSGNYGPPSRESGTGWRLDLSPSALQTVADVRQALDATPPDFCGKGWRYLTTVEQHLRQYGVSSRYTEFENT